MVLVFMKKTQCAPKTLRPDAMVKAVFGAVLAAVVCGCSSTSLNRAPVEDRSVQPRSHPSFPPANPAVNVGIATASTTEPAKVLPGAENAGKPGYYTVKPGDTLIRIGLDTGQNWKDLMKWNNFENPNLIEVGQVLRVVQPGADPNAVATRGVVSSRVETRPLDTPKPLPAAPSTSTSTMPAAVAVAGPSASQAATTPSVSAPAPVAREGDDNINWLWPASGPVVGQFDEAKSKGLTLSGKAGDPVLAAADGRVVYAGSGLRGYGNLVILKHNSTYLTAYAHNQSVLVKEDQTVRRGQKIAEMGSSDADRVQLHFEIRRQGKPIDPAKLLPAR
jgi:lipoprotein NlpD